MENGVGIIFFSIFCCLCVIAILLRLLHDSCVCFIVPFLLSLSLVPLIRCYWCIKTAVFVL